ncbi:endonuclease/exonuclease/phosphatase family protein [Streptomyces mayteni]
MTSQHQPTSLGVLTFNLNRPSAERAERQLAYLAGRPEQVLVLTETAPNAGCDLIAEHFAAAGYAVMFPRPPEAGERGTMIVSRLALRPCPTKFGYLPHRGVAATLDTDTGPLDIVGLYVPSRDITVEKVARKETFLRECRSALSDPAGRPRLVIGDFNILEPDHHPHFRFFRPFEYDFYRWLGNDHTDAFRHLHPTTNAYSWVGKTGDGYRYDHAHVSANLADTIRDCHYVHEPRTQPPRLTDHSALTLRLALTPTATLPITPDHLSNPRTLF